MAITKRTVLVLGAGSSCDLGFPLGPELRRQILTEGFPHWYMDDERLVRQISSFREAFLSSASLSIDEFLSRRTEFEQLGKQSIAYLIRKCESHDTLFRSDGPLTWRHHVLDRLVERTWSDTDLSYLSIVNFNYDRSFEYFLSTALRHRFRKSEDEVFEKLRSMRHIHVYGSLGSIDNSQDDFTQYGHDEYASTAGHNRIRVIPEGRNDDPCLEEARGLLIEAEIIVFLGFGFDSTNCERLDISNTSGLHAGPINRRVVASSLGMTRAERNAIACKVLDVESLASNELNGLTVNDFFFDRDCLGTLRESLVLGL